MYIPGIKAKHADTDRDHGEFIYTFNFLYA
jgi:hypothetical protein